MITKEKARRRDKLGVWYYHIHIYTTVAENNLMVTKGEKGGEGINQEIEVDVYILLYRKQIANKNLLYSTGNSTQYSIMTYMETKFE